MKNHNPFSHEKQGIAGPAWIIAAIFSIILIIVSLDNITSRAGWGPDDQLRMVQLRDFLNGQGWFDWTQYRMNAPDGAPMHWSRVIELPLALLIIIFSPIFGQDIAEMIAGTIIPLGGLAITSYMIGRISLLLWNRQAAIFAILLTWLNPSISFQFRPMRIDHHGWQIVLATLALWTMFWPSKKWAGIILGCALALWLHISLEGLPLTAAFFLILGWRWIIGKAHGQRLIWTILSFTLSTFFFYVSTQGMPRANSIYCDSISPPYLTAIAAAAVIMLVGINSTPQRRWMRLLIAGSAGAVAAAILITMAPQCTGGAFAQLDPLVRDYWYVNISEGQPIWAQSIQSSVMVIILPLLAIIALMIFAPRFPRNIRSRFYLLGFFIIYSTILSLFVFRTVTVANAYAIGLIAILLAQIWHHYRRAPNPIQRMSLLITMFIIAIAGPILSIIAGMFAPSEIRSQQPEKSSEQTIVICASPAGLESLKHINTPANILAPFNLSPMILLSTKHHVLASSHHRNEAAMRDQIDSMIGTSDNAKTIIERRKITHIVMCKDDPEWGRYASKHPNSFASALLADKAPSWLVKKPSKGHLLVWQVASHP